MLEQKRGEVEEDEEIQRRSSASSGECSNRQAEEEEAEESQRRSSARSQQPSCLGVAVLERQGGVGVGVLGVHHVHNVAEPDLDWQHDGLQLTLAAGS